MKIAVISAHYMPEVGYQEVHLARAFARIGHEVKVFTSPAPVKLGGKLGTVKYEEGLSRDPKLGFEILRLSSFSYKSKAYSAQLRRQVLAWSPDLLVILGVAKIFPGALLNERVHRQVSSVSIYGDAKEYLERGTLGQNIKNLLHEIGYSVIKRPLYLKAVKYCDRIVLNIPETDTFFRSILPQKLLPVYEQKKMMLNLGFDPGEYYYDEGDRAHMRSELQIADDEIVLMTSTRINRRKNLEQVVREVDELNRAGKKVRYIMVGFLGDAYEKELKAFIQATANPAAFTCFPFLPSSEIRKLYCASDAGIWQKAAISIQEAMGTGLPVILENKPSVNHLVKEGENGWFYEKNEPGTAIRKAVVALAAKKPDRPKLAAANASWLSYDSIARKIVDSVKLK
jgi:glycosyltransferase involved in cell wall biosynthesis